jgi:hypothetical protein
MGRLKAKLAAVAAVQALASRGGIEKHDSNAPPIAEEPEDDISPPAQQASFVQPHRQSSGYNLGQPDPSPYLSTTMPQYQYNHFAAMPDYSQSLQYHNTAPQYASQPPQNTSQQQYPPRDAQPPQTPTSENIPFRYHTDNYPQSPSSSYSQYPQSPPLVSASSSAQYPFESQQPYPSHLQRSYTVPPPQAVHSPGLYWSPELQRNHDCSQNWSTYVYDLLMFCTWTDMTIQIRKRVHDMLSTEIAKQKLSFGY